MSKDEILFFSLQQHELWQSGATWKKREEIYKNTNKETYQWQVTTYKFLHGWSSLG